MARSPYSQVPEYTRNGGPYDCGIADSYFGRPAVPRFYRGFSSLGVLVTEDGMNADEVAAYYAGYEDNEETGNKRN